MCGLCVNTGMGVPGVQRGFLSPPQGWTEGRQVRGNVCAWRLATLSGCASLALCAACAGTNLRYCVDATRELCAYVLASANGLSVTECMTVARWYCLSYTRFALPTRAGVCKPCRLTVSVVMEVSRKCVCFLANSLAQCIYTSCL